MGGSRPTAFLRAPDGTEYTTEQFAAMTGKKLQTVRSSIWRRKSYLGYEIVHHYPPRVQSNRKPRLGYDCITLRELYDQYLWCRDDPNMLTIMKGFAGTSDVTPLIKIFERWRNEAIGTCEA